MKYSRFEELPVWQAAIEFAIKIFEFTGKAEDLFRRRLGDTKSQLERAALSVSNNIAEGFERGTNAELINFLYIARGSAGESRSMLCLCEKLPTFKDFKSEIEHLKLRAESISKQLHGWIESLKNSEIKGVKFLTEKERRKIQQIKEDKEFQELLQKVTRGEKIDWNKI
ncbi:MAG: four helix bundle protein [Acidobacteriota bacterium]|nr:four helix bundle protein [Acidobacteriota bacterium]